CPTTAVYNGLDSEQQIPLGSHLRFFGDGYQKSKQVDGIRYWRIPVMDGEFLIEESCGTAKGVAGGNILIQTRDQITGLTAARRAVEAIGQCEDVITPFPGGVVRSGSKVGSRYKGMVASTSHPFCPTLVGRVESEVETGANCVYEIVVDGSSFEAVELALMEGVCAVVEEDVIAISAGNYGGKLGKHHYRLHDLMAKIKNR
ncbi:MAG: formylmethanofuran--tetrahydromethanopterin N-formyltransferase, partial [Planctomycetota bacterium]